jgi:hypothetical protein
MFFLAKSIQNRANSNCSRLFSRSSWRSASVMDLAKPPTTTTTGWMTLPANFSIIIWPAWRIFTTCLARSGAAWTIPRTFRTA